MDFAAFQQAHDARVGNVPPDAELDVMLLEAAVERLKLTEGAAFRTALGTALWHLAGLATDAGLQLDAIAAEALAVRAETPADAPRRPPPPIATASEAPAAPLAKVIPLRPASGVRPALATAPAIVRQVRAILAPDTEHAPAPATPSPEEPAP